MPSLHQNLITAILYKSLPKHVIKQLQRVKNAAPWVVSLSPKFCHITPVLTNLHWLPIDLQIEFKILIITYKTLHGQGPSYIENLLNSYIPTWDLRYSKKNLLTVPAFNLNRMVAMLSLSLHCFFGIISLNTLETQDH